MDNKWLEFRAVWYLLVTIVKRQTKKNEIQHDLDIHLNTYSVSETIQSMCFYSLPIIVLLRAHMHFQSGIPPTIDDAMLLKTISPGLWAIEQLCSIYSQFIFSAAIFQDVKSVGYFSTYLTVDFDFSHNVMAKILKKYFWINK